MNLPSPKEQEAILKYLVENPTIEHWGFCDTTDRKNHWVYCRAINILIRDFLKNHFAGLPLPTQLEEININIDGSSFKVTFSNLGNKQNPIIQEIGLWLDYYLALYAVISWGWKYIEPILKENNCSFPTTPGEALIEIINEISCGRLATYFPVLTTGNDYVEFSPRQAYNLTNQDTKFKLLKHRSTPLNKKEKRLISQHEAKMEKEKKAMLPFFTNTLLYISICMKNKKGDAVLQNRLSNLAKAASEFQSFIKHLSHPRNGIKGYALVKGVRLETVKEGGVYRS